MQQSRFIKVLILSSGQVLTALVSLLSTVALSRLFSQQDYATYRQTLLAYTFAVPFVTLGFDKALYYFLPNEDKRSRGVMIENLILLAAAGGLLSLFLLLGGNSLLANRFNNPELRSLLVYMIPFPLLMIPASGVTACLMARNKTKQVAVYNVTSRLMILLSIVIPCIIWPKVNTAIIGTVTGAVVTTGIGMKLMFRSCNTGNWFPTLTGIKNQARFSIPLGLASLLGVASQSLDQILVAMVCSTASFALYVNGAMEIPLIGMITGSMSSVLIVDYARLFREGKLNEIIKLIHGAMVKSSLLLFPAMVFLMCMAPELMKMLYGTAYENSSIPFRIYLLLLPIRILTYGALLNATGHSRSVLIQSIITLTMNAIFLWYSIQYFGPLYAPIGSVIAMYLFIMPYLIMTLRRILQCSLIELFPWAKLAKIIGVSCIGLPVLIFIKSISGSMYSIYVLVLSGSVYTVIIFVLFIVFGWENEVPWKELIKKIKTA